MTAVAIAGLAAATFGIASVALFGLAIGFDPAAGAEMVQRISGADASEVGYIRWAALTDALGYYLIPAFIIVAVRNRLAWPSMATRDVATTAGVVYVTIGSIGAGLMAVVVPTLIESNADRAVLVSWLLSVEALWQWIEPIPFTVWAAGTTLALRASSSAWSWIFLAMIIGGVLVWVGRVLGFDLVLIAGLISWLFPFPFVFAGVGSWMGGSEA